MTTPPADWRAALAAHPPRPLDPTAMGHVVVVAARPADAVRAVGTMMRAVHDAGGRLELVIVTEDAATDGVTDTGGRPGPADVPVHHLGLADPDPDVLARALAPLLHDADAYLAPWAGDPDPVHAAAGRAAAAAAPVTACGWGYPVGMWSRMRPDDPSIPWAHAFAHAPGTRAEVVFRIPRVDGAPRSRFDELYAGADGAGDGDPWETHTSWYERRKRDVVLACLPAERYRHAAEPACGTGVLTRGMAERCDRVDASDFSPAAVAQTATATAGCTHVKVARLALPDPVALPAGIDLVVLSEVLYYLSDADLGRTVDRLAEAVEPGGDIVLVHWDGWPAEAPRDGTAAHRVLLDDPRFEPLVEHADEEFLLHVLRRW